MQRTRIVEPFESASITEAESLPDGAAIANSREFSEITRSSIERRIEELTREVTSIALDEDHLQGIVNGATDEVTLHLPGERANREQAQREIEFHLLCTLFCILRDAADTIGDAVAWTVESLIQVAFVGSDDTLVAAAIKGASEAVGEKLGDQVSAYFLTVAGLPDAKTLQALAILFCPNSKKHPDVLEAEKTLSKEFAVEAVADYLRSNR